MAEESIRTPPHNFDAECSVLGCVMLDNTTLATAAGIISSSDFYSPAHRAIWEAMENLDRAHLAIEPISLSEELRAKGKDELAGGNAYICKLEAYVLLTGLMVQHAIIIRQHSLRRQIIAFSQQIGEDAHDGGADTQELLGSLQRELSRLQQGQQSGAKHVRHACQIALDRMEAARKTNNPITGTATGYRKLDNLLGGMQRSDMVVLAARPSVGKTALALNILNEVTINHRLPAIMFSLETSAPQVAQRLASIRSGVPLWKQRSPSKMYLSETDLITTAMRDIGSSRLIIDDTPGIEVSLMRARARQYKERQNDLALIVIDYVQLVHDKSVRWKDNRQAMFAEISGQIKGIAIETDTPVLCVAQLSRAAEGSKRPKMSHLKETGALEQDADVVLLLHREQRDESDYQRIQLIVDKHRNGACGDISFVFYAPPTQFREE